MALDPITAGLDLAKGLGEIINKFIPDRDAAQKAQLEMQARVVDAFNAQNQGQIEVNKIEAASPSLFVAGWRPFVGWVCGVAFAWAFVLAPMLAALVRIWRPQYVPLALDTGSLIAVLTAMLGLGSMRTYEKVQGIEPPTVPTVTTKEVRRALPAPAKG